MNKDLIELFEDLFDGHPWLDVNIMHSLQRISYTAAPKKIFSNQNSIWEIVNHMIAWREMVLERINGKQLVSPENNFFAPITDTSEKAWRQTIDNFKLSQQKWIHFLKETPKDTFLQVYKPNQMNYFKHIQGILQHDAYHLGQINILAKYV